MGVLVQPSTSAGIDRRHPAGRSRRKVLSTTCSTRCGTCFTLTKQPPRFPVRFKVPSYSPEFKEQTVRKLMPPHNRTVASLSQEIGVSEATLYNWKKQFRA